MTEIIPIDVASQLLALRERGVTNPQQFASLDAKTISETIQWFDSQNGRVSAGVLVHELRNGGRRAKRQSILAQEKEYATGIVKFLRARYPDLCDPNPHPAAVATVTRLHFLRGKDLPAVEYDTPIFEAVKRWDERFGDEPVESRKEAA